MGWFFVKKYENFIFTMIDSTDSTGWESKNEHWSSLHSRH
jgi:hypothetical protein